MNECFLDKTRLLDGVLEAEACWSGDTVVDEAVDEDEDEEDGETPTCCCRVAATAAAAAAIATPT